MKISINQIVSKFGETLLHVVQHRTINIFSNILILNLIQLLTRDGELWKSKDWRLQ